MNDSIVTFGRIKLKNCEFIIRPWATSSNYYFILLILLSVIIIVFLWPYQRLLM